MLELVGQTQATYYRSRAGMIMDDGAQNVTYQNIHARIIVEFVRGSFYT